MSETRLYFQRRLRAIAPSFVKQGYRVLRSIKTPPSSPVLPEELVASCRMCASRNHMLDYLPQKATVCEVGTYKGDFARAIVKKTNPNQLHLIDIDYTYFSDEGLRAPNIECHTGHSVGILSQFPDETFDWIYIDADHSYQGCKTDALASAAKIKSGGYIVFNDYAHIDPSMGRYGVHRAATEFAVENNWTMAFFAYQPNGLYDVAFRKPE